MDIGAAGGAPAGDEMNSYDGVDSTGKDVKLKAEAASQNGDSDVTETTVTLQRSLSLAVITGCTGILILTAIFFALSYVRFADERSREKRYDDVRHLVELVNRSLIEEDLTLDLLRNYDVSATVDVNFAALRRGQRDVDAALQQVYFAYQSANPDANSLKANPFATIDVNALARVRAALPKRLISPSQVIDGMKVFRTSCVSYLLKLSLDALAPAAASMHAGIALLDVVESVASETTRVLALSRASATPSTMTSFLMAQKQTSILFESVAAPLSSVFADELAIIRRYPQSAEKIIVAATETVLRRATEVYPALSQPALDDVEAARAALRRQLAKLTSFYATPVKTPIHDSSVVEFVASGIIAGVSILVVLLSTWRWFIATIRDRVEKDNLAKATTMKAALRRMRRFLLRITHMDVHIDASKQSTQQEQTSSSGSTYVGGVSSLLASEAGDGDAGGETTQLEIELSKLEQPARALTKYVHPLVVRRFKAEKVLLEAQAKLHATQGEDLVSTDPLDSVGDQELQPVVASPQVGSPAAPPSPLSPTQAASPSPAKGKGKGKKGAAQNTQTPQAAPVVNPLAPPSQLMINGVLVSSIPDGHLLTDDLKLYESAILFISLHGFQRRPTSDTVKVLPGRVTKLLELIKSSVAQHGGILHAVSDNVIVTFNVGDRNDEPASAACAAALEITRNYPDQRWLRCAVATGTCLAGFVTTATTKNWCVIGEPMQLGPLLLKFANLHDVRLIVDHGAFEQLDSQIFQSRSLEMITLNPEVSQSGITVYDVSTTTSNRKGGVVSDKARAAHTLWNKVFEGYVKEETGALEQLVRWEEEFGATLSTRRLANVIARQEGPPTSGTLSDLTDADAILGSINVTNA